MGYGARVEPGEPVRLSRDHRDAEVEMAVQRVWLDDWFVMASM